MLGKFSYETKDARGVQQIAHQPGMKVQFKFKENLTTLLEKIPVYNHTEHQEFRNNKGPGN